MNELKALILCGGKGERLKPITNKIPKPLVKIGEDSILGHQLKYLKGQGINSFCLATGYKSKLIEEYVEDNYNNYQIKIINSGKVDIMKRIKDCLPYLTDDFLVCYGDTLANVDVNALYKFHKDKKSKATVTSYQLESQFGILTIDDKGLVINFQEKPKLNIWINIGYFIFNRKKFEVKSYRFKDFINYLSNNRYLYSYKHEGLHITINTLDELEQARLNINKFT